MSDMRIIFHTVLNSMETKYLNRKIGASVRFECIYGLRVQINRIVFVCESKRRILYSFSRIVAHARDEYVLKNVERIAI